MMEAMKNLDVSRLLWCKFSDVSENRIGPIQTVSRYYTTELQNYG
jgi:hypothetical protein